jgi:hypothetical protein
MELLSPELVLVASPEEAAAARASLVLPRPPAPRTVPRLGRATLATIYATCLVMTVTPVALLAILSHAPH